MARVLIIKYTLIQYVYLVLIRQKSLWNMYILIKGKIKVCETHGEVEKKG